MKMDMHCHVKEGSPDSKISLDEYITVLKANGFGGMLTIDAGSLEKANATMEMMQQKNMGYLAVSLGFYKTLFSAPGSSTSSEIPEDEQKEMGLTDGLIRFSIGLDTDIERTFQTMMECLKANQVI